MKTKKIISILLTLFISTSLFVGCDSTKKVSKVVNPTGKFDLSKASIIKPTVLGKIQTGSKAPSEDKLTPIWEEKTKVKPETVTMQANQDGSQYFSMMQVAGTMPNVIAPTNGVFDNPAVVNTLLKQNSLHEITLADIKNYMPLTTQRLKKWGISVDEWYKSNVNASTGKLWYVPGAPNLSLTSVKNESFVKTNSSYEPYTWYFRDDVLKKIFPTAKTEKELRDLDVQKKGKLTYEDVNDVPIKNLDDFYNYLKQVKALNMKTPNGKAIIPAQIQNTADAASMMWSAYSLSGLFWGSLADRLVNVKDSKFTYFAGTEGWKEYISWFNKIYSEKLLDPETFIQKDDQRDAKVVNGQYAVFQGWLNVTGARKNAKDYGYRKVALFNDDKLSNDYQDTSEMTYGLSQSWGAVGLTTSLDKAQIPQILNWIDWNYSQEANTLRAWGPSQFTTGTGKNKKFTAEYKSVEEWALGGKESDKDGVYYGLYPLSVSDVSFNQETYGIGTTWYDEYAPINVYPPDVSNAANIDIDTTYDNAIKLHNYSSFKRYEELPLGSDVIELQRAFNEAEKVFAEQKKTASFDCDGAKTATVKAIVKPTSDFEKNYQNYLTTYITPDFLKTVKDMGDKYLAYQKLYNDKYRKAIK